MVSPANTYVGLTRPSVVPGEPQKYFPSGKRNYARVAIPDNFQGAADAQFAQSKGWKKIYVLNDGETYGAGIAANFVNAAKSLGITILGNDKWDAKAANYQAEFQKIQGTSPDAVFLGGIVSNNGAQLIKDKVAVLGDNTKVPLMGPDGFNTTDTITGAGAAAEGMYVTIGGSSPNDLKNTAGSRLREGVQGGLQGQDAAGLHGLRRRGDAGRCSRRSRSPTARARHLEEALQPDRAELDPRARSRSTRSATRSTAATRRRPGHDPADHQRQHRAPSWSRSRRPRSPPRRSARPSTTHHPAASHLSSQTQRRPAGRSWHSCQDCAAGSARSSASPSWGCWRLAGGELRRRRRGTFTASSSRASRTAPCTPSWRSATRSSTASSS